ncbi:hypothetical protein VOLCADRAFT_98114 [Volvox carteri f. nagariensis]|uniref:von Hippel-Lindau disease tumour suppressor beta domain-containing protein n=1 Tax=Volvox carteri f. nagariensis TaxID=3068 RepID=D8UEH2_VOLCA|nr:uncharacterized protein VOLCADRAFT_98114 [Volvox carteri f. nagariensis]EFJ41843.1 hypothetical protein VOLCADRAFT_98114 [Volvox carteri f. nagariensis]|eukprot:XP_002957041.1 hypothetical protein VOLCADRAFT_98114 [Volvox carteri f. nagariensis]
MCFTNRTSFVVEAFWLNFNGEEVSYGLIKPGATHLLYTYLTHPWVFRNHENNKEVLVVHGKPVCAVRAVILDRMVWTPWFHLVSTVVLFAAKSERQEELRHGELPLRHQKAPQQQQQHWRSTSSAPQAPAPVPATHPSPNPNAGSTCIITTSEAAVQYHPAEEGLLGKLPFDIILEIIAKMAPPLRGFKPLLKEDIEMMPRGVQPAKGPVALLAAKILGPTPPPAPVADPEAWFAAANAAALAAAPQQLFGDFGAQLAENGPPAPPPPAQEHQPHQVAGPDAAAGALPHHVAEVMMYTEAAVLANAAFAHAHDMAVQQEVQAQALLRFLVAQVQAQAQAAAAQQQQQQQQPQHEGEQEGEGQEQQEGDPMEEAASEYGDADGADAEEGQVWVAPEEDEWDGTEPNWDAFVDADDAWGNAVAASSLSSAQ